MRQLVAAFLMVGTLAAPILRAVCELSCVPGAEQTTAAAPSCHEASPEPVASSPLSLEAPDSCGDHTQLPAVAASLKNRAGLAPLALQLSVESEHVVLARVSARALHDHAPGATPPPIPPGTRILRI